MNKSILCVAMLVFFVILGPSPATAFGKEEGVAPKLLILPGESPSKSRLLGLQRILYLVRKRTSIKTQAASPISLDDPHLFAYPFLYLTGSTSIPTLSQKQKTRLATFLTTGGFLFVDATDGDPNGPFLASVKQLFQQIFPHRPVVPLPDDHVIYSSFYLLNHSYGRLPAMEPPSAIFDGDRAVVIFHANDLAGALARDLNGNWLFHLSPDTDRQREMARRFAINLVMYATCLNYKKDQAHIPFIMKRRQWQL